MRWALFEQLQPRQGVRKAAGCDAACCGPIGVIISRHCHALEGSSRLVALHNIAGTSTTLQPTGLGQRAEAASGVANTCSDDLVAATNGRAPRGADRSSHKRARASEGVFESKVVVTRCEEAAAEPVSAAAIEFRAMRLHAAAGFSARRLRRGRL